MDIKNFVLAILVTLSLIFSGVALYTAFNAEGEQGLPGSDGPMGPMGEQGDPGENGTNGEDGEDGTNGTNGTNGEQGPPGKDGEDGSSNQVPIVTLNDLNVTYEYTGLNVYTYSINVSVDDPEDDNMHIAFYWRSAPEENWNKNNDYIGTDGIYIAEVSLPYSSPQAPLGIYWLVETWDGSDIGLDYFEYSRP